MSLKDTDVKKIQDRYGRRLATYGYSPKTLGWSDRNQQNLRFRRFADRSQYQEKRVLDVGCGFGDFFSYLQAESLTPSYYLGIDINPDIIDLAGKYNQSDRSAFLCCDICKDTGLLRETGLFDVVSAAGVFNLNFCNDMAEMYSFVEEMINVMTSYSDNQIVFDFIPEERCDQYEQEDYIATYSLSKISKMLNRANLRYIIDMSQDPNPMTEALVIASKRKP